MVDLGYRFSYMVSKIFHLDLSFHWRLLKGNESKDISEKSSSSSYRVDVSGECNRLSGRYQGTGETS
jgi:hypothetical protein